MEPLTNIGDFVGVDMWQLWPLFPQELQQKLIARFGDKEAPLYFMVEATKEKHPFLSTFLFKNGIISNTETSKRQKAYLTSIFYGCKDTPYSEIWDNVTNGVVSERHIKEAKRLDLIQEKNGYISYLGFGHE